MKSLSFSLQPDGVSVTASEGVNSCYEFIPVSKTGLAGKFVCWFVRRHFNKLHSSIMQSSTRGGF